MDDQAEPLELFFHTRPRMVDDYHFVSEYVKEKRQ